MTSVSRAQHLHDDARRYFEEVQRGNYVSNAFFYGRRADESETLDILDQFIRDSVVAVREKAYEVLATLTSRSGSAGTRMRGVETLIQACTDADPGASSMAADLLTKFHKADFSAAAKDTLKRIITGESPHLPRLVKLAGFLEIADLKAAILRWSGPGNPVPLRWSAILSLARMGEPQAVAQMMYRVKKLPVTDDMVYHIFPDLVYTRQPEAIAWMVTELHNDEKNCRSADTERETAIPCGYRIMEQLAPVIEGFPFRLEESGDLNTGDYVAALATVRQWFSVNKKYTILNDKY